MTSPPLDDPVARVREELDSGKFHPLEIFPVFRRWPCSMVRDLVYTFIWNCGFGLVFFGLDVALGGGRISFAKFYAYMLVSNIIGYIIHLAYSIGGALGLERWARRSNFIAKVFYYAAVPTLSVTAGFWFVSKFMDIGIRGWNASAGAVFSILVSSIVISLVLSVVFFWRERSAVAEAMIERERTKMERIEREAALANLRALQAQIEPHFLFNTLANVTGLIDPDPAKAKRMLESFIRFLRATLAATRAESTTLGAESELISAFLDVLAVRMGSRLRYTVDVEPALHSFELPPMLVQPVVENAIKHGLEPKVDGGEIAVRARREGTQVEIEVADTGMGFAPTTAGGVGLTNLRDRLRLLYGERAGLDIRENSPSGTLITIRLPA
jgi:signal transduction histidine kinase